MIPRFPGSCRAVRFCWLLALLTTGCARPGIGADPRWGRPDAIRPEREWMVLTPAFRIVAPEIRETSGLVCSGGNYFVHNDSGDRPRLFRASRLDFADAEELPAPGARAIDWEEITTFRGDLLVCDTGDNRGRRQDVMLYRYAFVPGDSGDGGRLELRARYPVGYPDGRHDVEAAFTIDDHLYLITKDRGDGTRVFRFATLRDGSELAPGSLNVPELVGMLDLGGEQVTAAAYDRRHEAVFLLMYSGIAVYPAGRLDGPPARTTRIWARQAEAICVQGDSLVFANEQRDVFVVEHFLENPRDEALPPVGEGTLRTWARLGDSKGAFSSKTVGTDGVRIDGDASEWVDEAAPLPLRNSEPSESFRWLRREDRILICARLGLEMFPEPSDPESLHTGSGVLLSFADAASRSTFLDGSQTQLFAEASSGSARAWRLSFRGYDLASMTPVAGSAIAASVEPPTSSGPGWFSFEASIPLDAIWSDRAVPPEFHFDLQGIALREDEEVHFSAADLYSIYRPYAWGNIILTDR